MQCSRFLYNCLPLEMEDEWFGGLKVKMDFVWGSKCKNKCTKMKSRVKERQKDNSIRREKSRTDTWKKKKSVRLYFGADLTCSQHVSPLINHHLCGRWHSERPGRKLSWSADLLPPQKHRGRGGEGRGGILRCQESSTGLKTKNSSCQHHKDETQLHASIHSGVKH